MTERTVTDEQIGQLYRRQNELYRRVREGSLDFEEVMASLQDIIENRRILPPGSEGCGELEVREAVRKWVEEGGLLYITVTSDGTTGEEWIVRLERRGYRLSDYAEEMLRSEDFVPTSGKTYRIAILPGSLFSDDDRITSNIREEAGRRGLEDPSPEVACLLREFLSDDDLEAMGLWWLAVMHEPIEDSGGVPGLLALGRSGGGRGLGAICDRPGGRWARVFGFAFVVPQASSGPYR